MAGLIEGAPLVSTSVFWSLPLWRGASSETGTPCCEIGSDALETALQYSWRTFIDGGCLTV